jgi:hypothetical protein
MQMRLFRLFQNPILKQPGWRYFQNVNCQQHIYASATYKSRLSQFHRTSVYAKVCELIGISLVPRYLRYTRSVDNNAYEIQVS